VSAYAMAIQLPDAGFYRFTVAGLRLPVSISLELPILYWGLS
jgi:hypothetical protein